MHTEQIPFIAVQSGVMPCVACSDFKTRPGQMWLGVTRGGEDMFITCPVCQGTAEVARMKHLDARTGREIDYEKPGQKFIYLGTK
jgi:hypothetical protein